MRDHMLRGGFAMLTQSLIAQTFSFKGSFAAQRDGTLLLSSIIAERKAFLSKKQLTYRCRVRVNDPAKDVLLFEILEERGSGLSTGNDDDEFSTPGFGFKVEKYDTRKGVREGTIEEQSVLFGKTYSYIFDYAEVRSAVQALATQAGYTMHTTLSEREVIKG
jgi:hypothetical protein